MRRLKFGSAVAAVAIAAAGMIPILAAPAGAANTCGTSGSMFPALAPSQSGWKIACTTDALTKIDNVVFADTSTASWHHGAARTVVATLANSGTTFTVSVTPATDGTVTLVWELATARTSIAYARIRRPGQAFGPIVPLSPPEGVATDVMAAAAPDGTTLFLSHDHTISILPQVMKNPGFDPAQDFVPVAGFASFVNAWAVSGGTPAKSFNDYVAWVRQQGVDQPGGLEPGGFVMQENFVPALGRGFFGPCLAPGGVVLRHATLTGFAGQAMFLHT